MTSIEKGLLPMILISIVSIFITYNRNTIWYDGLNLWIDPLFENPNKGRVHNNLGAVYGKMGFMDDALRSYIKAVELESGLHRTLNRLHRTLNYIAIIYKDKGLFENAIKYWHIALEVYKDFTDAYNNLGAIYLEIGQYAKAIEYLQSAIKTNPNYPDTYYNLGILYEKLDLQDEAIKNYRIAIRIKPNFAFAYNNLSAIYEAQGNIEDALLAIQKAYMHEPENEIISNNFKRLHAKNK